MAWNMCINQWAFSLDLRGDEYCLVDTLIVPYLTMEFDQLLWRDQLSMAWRLADSMKVLRWAKRPQDSVSGWCGVYR